MRTISKFTKVSVVIVTCLLMGGCDDVRVYGSVGYSSYGGHGGYGGGPRVGVGVGGRIY